MQRSTIIIPEALLDRLAEVLGEMEEAIRQARAEYEYGFVDLNNLLYVPTDGGYVACDFLCDHLEAHGSMPSFKDVVTHDITTIEAVVASSLKQIREEAEHRHVWTPLEEPGARRCLICGMDGEV